MSTNDNSPIQMTKLDTVHYYHWSEDVIILFPKNSFLFSQDEIVKVYTSREDYDHEFPFVVCRAVAANHQFLDCLIPLFFCNNHPPSMTRARQDPQLLYLNSRNNERSEKGLLHVERCHTTLQLSHLSKEEDFIGKSFCCHDKECLSKSHPSKMLLLDLFSHPIYSTIDVFHSCHNPILKIPSNKILLTGISSIDLFSTIYVGQHAIISTATQLPHHSLIMQICEQVSIYSPPNSLDLHLSEIENSSSTNESNQHDNTTELILVFCLQSYSPQQDCKIFKSFFTNTTHRLQHKSVYLCNCHTCGLSMNHASIPNSAWNGMEDCLPYIAMSISEYLAFHCHKHVLFIWYELSSFISKSFGSCWNVYHGALKSKFSNLFSRCGVVKGKNSGSLSALSVIENPNDDHSHKFVDVLNGVADCTIVWDRSLTNDCRQLYPPIKMEWGRFRIPARTTTSISFSEYWDPIRSIRKDVSFVRNVLLRLVHEAKEIHSQYAILAWDCVLLDDQIMMDFLTALELRVISQRRDEYRHLCETLNLVWKLLVEFFSLKCLKWKYPVPYSEEASLVDELYSSFAKLTKRRRILNMEIFQMNLFKKCQKGQFNDMILHAQR